MILDLNRNKSMMRTLQSTEPRFFTGCVDMTAMAGETNAVRLETAFRVAETELGVARLLDPEVRKTLLSWITYRTNPNFIKIRLGCCVIAFPGSHWRIHTTSLCLFGTICPTI